MKNTPYTITTIYKDLTSFCISHNWDIYLLHLILYVPLFAISCSQIHLGDFRIALIIRRKLIICISLTFSLNVHPLMQFLQKDVRWVIWFVFLCVYGLVYCYTTVSFLSVVFLSIFTVLILMSLNCLIFKSFNSSESDYSFRLMKLK